MNESDDWDGWLESVHDAARRFADIEYDALTRRAIYRLQRHEASRIYGDDYIYKSLWDEYCHEIQEGPHDLLDEAWAMTLNAILDDLITLVPAHVAALLYAYQGSEEQVSANLLRDGGYDPELIRDVLVDRLRSIAGGRNLLHLGPWRDDQI
jgi:hypothetical protein